ncbi:MAG: hypothetical protein P9M14_04920 [Candidatus Alcyoniella australis]|nr:hypothetical protein [Candidatus Alcyoniella australis]
MISRTLILSIAILLILAASNVLAGDTQTMVLQPEEVQTRYLDLDTVPISLTILVDLHSDQAANSDLEQVQAQKGDFVDLTTLALLQEDSHASLE